MVTFLCMLAGCVLGAWLCHEVFDESVGLAGALFGLLGGWFFSRLSRLGRRVRDLEAALKSLSSERQTAGFVTQIAADTDKTADAAAPPVSRAAATTVVAEGASETGRLGERGALIEPALAEAREAVLATALSAPDGRGIVSSESLEKKTASHEPEARIEPPSPPQESVLWVWMKRWFTEGNVPVKIGVIVLFFGIAYLLKYAADQGWLSVPIEFRFLGVAVMALAALGFAWRKRESHRAFALSLQGGSIGVLILTIFTAYRLYALLPPAFAFALLIVIVAGAGLLAVLQDALALALLAIVGGFLAPILISTGSNNPIELFGYYAVLNTAIFVIAWIKPWRALNLVGFAFTFGIGTFWGVLSYRPELFSSTEPFLLLFFAFYLLLPLLYALRLAQEKRDFVDGSLVFGTPLVAFALQAALLHGDRMPLAFSALGAAAIYTALAILELRRWRLTLLGESHALLALGFATLAVPLALSARATACTFALEGAALIWLGLRQQRRMPRWIGYVLQALAGFAFIAGYGGSTSMKTIFNGEYFGALILALAGLTSSRLLARTEERAPLATVFFTWGALWWYVAGAGEIDRFVSGSLPWDWRLSAIATWWLGFVALSALIAVEVHRRFVWRECLILAAATIPLGLPFIGLTMLNDHGPLEGWPILAWALWLIATWRSLPAIATRYAAAGRILHFVYLWIIVLLVGTELAHLADTHFQLSHVWIGLAALTPSAALFLLALRRAKFVRWPLGDIAEVLRNALLATLTALLGLGWLLGLVNEGRPAPLPYIDRKSVV